MSKKKFYYFIATVIYPNYIIVSYKNASVMAFNKSILHLIGIDSFIYENIGVFNLIFWASIFLFPGFVFYKLEKWEESKVTTEKEDIEKNLNIYRLLVVSIDKIIESKRRRFLNYLTSIESDQFDSNLIFPTITQPLMQIVEIATRLQYIMSKTVNNDEVKVSIIKCTNNGLHSYLFHSDDTPTASIENLANSKSTATQAIRKKSMIVIPCTESMNKKKVWFYDGSGTIKSILCFPVITGSNINFLISITSKISHDFKEVEKKQYELILKQMASRITLESYLHEIKSKQSENA